MAPEQFENELVAFQDRPAGGGDLNRIDALHGKPVSIPTGR